MICLNGHSQCLLCAQIWLFVWPKGINQFFLKTTIDRPARPIVVGPMIAHTTTMCARASRMVTSLGHGHCTILTNTNQSDMNEKFVGLNIKKKKSFRKKSFIQLEFWLQHTVTIMQFNNGTHSPRLVFFFFLPLSCSVRLND